MMGGCAAIPEASVPSQVGATASPLVPTLPPTATPTAVLPTDPAPELPALQITYICNDGFAVSVSGKRILVDALFNDVNGVCPANLEVAAPAAVQALGGAHLVLVSHSHWDHFDPQVVGSYLLSNPDSVLIAEHSAAEALAAEFEHFPDIQGRVHGLELDRGQETQMSFSGIEVEVISAPADVPNLGFIVRVGGSTFLHSGDSGYDSTMAADFRALAAGRQGYRPRIPPLLVLHRPVWPVHRGRSPRPLLRPDALCGGATIGRLPCREKPLSSRNLVQKSARDLASMRSNRGGAFRSLQGLPNNSLKLTRRAGALGAACLARRRARRVRGELPASAGQLSSRPLGGDEP